MSASSPPPRWLGLLTSTLGLVVLLVGLGVIPVPPESIHAPRWVIALCGVVFALAGVALLTDPASPLRVASGGTIVFSFGLIAGWVALFGDAEGFSGGVPFLSAAANVAVARGLFGLGALMCFAIFVHGTRQLVRGRFERGPAEGQP